jgi:predicted RNase H-like nuclease (RuvC/YqgF family)
VSDNALQNAVNDFLRITARSCEFALLAGNRAAIAVVSESLNAVKLMIYKNIWEDIIYNQPRQALIRRIAIQAAEADRRQQQRAERQRQEREAENQDRMRRLEAENGRLQTENRRVEREVQREREMAEMTRRERKAESDAPCAGCNVC